jgi:hypothetical protein
MYQFKIKKQEGGGYKFELGVISIIIDGYTIKDDTHLLSNPGKAIAYFCIEDNLYGISNDPLHYYTVEAFYDAMNKQYMIFNSNCHQHIA